jgi:hypothetical protein
VELGSVTDKADPGDLVGLGDGYQLGKVLDIGHHSFVHNEEGTWAKRHRLAVYLTKCVVLHTGEEVASVPALNAGIGGELRCCAGGGREPDHLIPLGLQGSTEGLKRGGLPGSRPALEHDEALAPREGEHCIALFGIEDLASGGLKVGDGTVSSLARDSDPGIARKIEQVVGDGLLLVETSLRGEA